MYYIFRITERKSRQLVCYHERNLKAGRSTIVTGTALTAPIWTWSINQKGARFKYYSCSDIAPRLIRVHFLFRKKFSSYGRYRAGLIHGCNKHPKYTVYELLPNNVFRGIKLTII